MALSYKHLRLCPKSNCGFVLTTSEAVLTTPVAVLTALVAVLMALEALL